MFRLTNYVKDFQNDKDLKFCFKIKFIIFKYLYRFKIYSYN